MPSIPYLTGGESPTAARMNTLFEEADRKVSLALADHSLLWFAGRDPFLSVPYFFIADSSASSVFASLLFREEYAVHGTGLNHDQSLFQPVVDAAPLVSGYEDAVLHARMLDDSDGGDLSEHFHALRDSFLGQPWQVNPLTRSLAVLQQDGWNLFTRLGTSQCALLRAQVELVFEGHSTYEWPEEWDRFNVFRVHNLSSTALTVTFPGHTLVVPAYGSRCTRRVVTGETTTWTDGWNHFQRMLPGDPYYWAGGSRPLTWALPPGASCHTACNITAPKLLLDLFAALDVNGFATAGANIFGASPGGGHLVFDESRFWDPGTFNGRYGAVDSAEPLADALICRGDLAVVSSTESAAQSTRDALAFEGTSGAAWNTFTLGIQDKLSVTVNGDGSITFASLDSGGNVDILSIGCNLVWSAMQPHLGRALSSATVGPDDGDCGLSGGVLKQRNGDSPGGTFTEYANSTVDALNVQYLAPALNGGKSAITDTVLAGSTTHSNYSGYSNTGTELEPVWVLNTSSPVLLEVPHLALVAGMDGASGLALFNTPLVSLPSRFSAGAATLQQTVFGPLLRWEQSLDLKGGALTGSIVTVSQDGTRLTSGGVLVSPRLFHLGERYFPALTAAPVLTLNRWPIGQAVTFWHPPVLGATGYHWAGKPRYFTRRRVNESAPVGDDGLPAPAWHTLAQRNPSAFTDDALRRHETFKVPGFSLTAPAFECMGFAYWFAGQSGPFDGVHAAYSTILTPTPGDASVITAEELYRIQFGEPVPPGLPDLLYSRPPGTASVSWYRKQRVAVMANSGRDITTLAVPVAQPADGVEWTSGPGGLVPDVIHGDAHLPLAVEHYNAIASLVNAAVRVRPLSLLDFGWPFQPTVAGAPGNTAWPVPAGFAAYVAPATTSPLGDLLSLADATVHGEDGPVPATTWFEQRARRVSITALGAETPGTFWNHPEVEVEIGELLTGSEHETSTGLPPEWVNHPLVAGGGSGFDLATNGWRWVWHDPEGRHGLAWPFLHVGSALRLETRYVEPSLVDARARDFPRPGDPAFTGPIGAIGTRLVQAVPVSEVEDVTWVGPLREYLAPVEPIEQGVAVSWSFASQDALATRFTLGGTWESLPATPFIPVLAGTYNMPAEPFRRETGQDFQPALYVSAQGCAVTVARYPVQHLQRSHPSDAEETEAFWNLGHEALPLAPAPADPGDLDEPTLETITNTDTVLAAGTACERLRLYVDLTSAIEE